MQLVTSLLFAISSFLSRVFAAVSRLCLALAHRCEPADIQQRSVIASTHYDMVRAPDEPFYAEQYWRIMLAHLKGLPQTATALDLGCGQGRFAVRLAKLFAQGKVVACDLSEKAIFQARENAARDSLGNIDFQAGTIADCVEHLGAVAVDVVLLTEVTIFYPNWEQDFPRILRTLKPGGILMISFRSQYFEALCVARSRLWKSVESVLQDRQGAILGSSTVFTWQTSAEIRTLLSETHGLELLELHGIGACSGIPGDPHDHICRPSQLGEGERELLMRLELELGKSVPDGGRYVLAVARKSK